MKNNLIKVSVHLTAFSLLLLPIALLAEDTNGLAPDCEGWDCSFTDFFDYVKYLMNFLIFTLGIPVAVVLIIWAGVLYLTTGISGKKEKAKAMLKAVVWGLLIMLGAWTFVNFILATLLKDNFREVPNLAPR